MDEAESKGIRRIKRGPGHGGNDTIRGIGGDDVLFGDDQDAARLDPQDQPVSVEILLP